MCTRFVPYFTIAHPTRGTLPGPFFKLPGAHRKLILDVVATMLYDQDVRTGAEELSGALERSLIGQDGRQYWDQILMTRRS